MPYVHHTILHFVLGLAFLPALLGVVAWKRNGGVWPVELRWIVYLIAMSAIVTAASGLFSAPHVIAGGMPAAKVELHRNLALGASALWLLIAAATVWAGRSDDGGRYKALTVASVLATGLVSLAGHFGGDMLHPGLAPWATAPHAHGPGAASADHSAMVMPSAAPAPPSGSSHDGMPMPVPAQPPAPAPSAPHGADKHPH